MAMTGVRARRVVDAEVKLDTAFYRLRDRFFGSRVGSRAFNAVAFSLGTNRGMVCGTVSWFQLRMRLWRGNGCVQLKGRRKGFRMSCTSRLAFECDLRTARTGRADPALLRRLGASSHVEKGDRGNGARRTLARRRRLFATKRGYLPQSIWSSSQNQRGASIGKQARLPA